MSTHSRPVIANSPRQPYSSPVAANSATGFGHPSKSRRTSATVSKAGAFFVPAILLYGGCARGAFGRAGFLDPRLTNLRTAATHSFGHERGGSSIQGAVPMKYLHALNPSKLRAAAHRRMAFAALNADSSLSTRLARYTHHITKARALEAVGGAQ